MLVQVISVFLSLIKDFEIVSIYDNQKLLLTKALVCVCMLPTTDWAGPLPAITQSSGIYTPCSPNKKKGMDLKLIKMYEHWKNNN